MLSVQHSLLFSCALVMASGCPDRTVALLPVQHSAETQMQFDVNLTRDVDILFIVDNSGSMEREQTSLTEKFGIAIDTLASHGGEDGELPSLHIAVATTDLGGGSPDNLCGLSGEDGAFQGAHCPELDGSFLRTIRNEDGSRTENFTGELSDVFACMATLGTRGCGLEQPLEAMRRALSGEQADAFLREHAFLAVVIVTDEDDCSAHNTDLFSAGNQGLDSHLGPPRSFRCFEFGVQCDQDGPLVRSEGPRSGCTARDGSTYLYDVDEYVQFLYELKASPNQVLVATIAGELSPVHVSARRENNQDFVAVDYSCTRPDAEAIPPIRLHSFVQGFPRENARETSICEDDLSGALDDIAELIARRSAACLEGAIADISDEPGLQSECVVALREPGAPEVRLPLCDSTDSPQNSSEFPCYTLAPSPVCAGTETGLSPTVHYQADDTAPVGATAEIRCAAPSA